MKLLLLQNGVRRVGVARVLLGPGTLPGGEKRRPASDWFVCAVPFQHMPEWCQRTNCVNTPYTCRGFFFFGTPTQVSAAMAILANAMVGHGGVRELYNLTRAEYFIPAYHFVYIPYWQWPDTGGTSVRNISLCTLPTLSP